MAKRRRKTAGSSRRRRHKPGWVEEAFLALWPPLRSALPWLVLGAAILATAAVGADRMRRNVLRRARFRIDPASLRIEHTQPVGSVECRLAIEPRDLPERLSALEGGVASRIAQAYARDSWVEEVHRVTIGYPNRVNVDLVPRTPVAFVQVGSAYYWVDRHGVCLPGEWHGNMPEGTGLVFITGAREPVPMAGQSWLDEGVRAGAETALILKDDVRALGITAVDVSNINGRRNPHQSEIALLTNRYTRILWGRPPYTDRPGELAPEAKRRQLLEAARRGYLAGRGTVDVRFPDLIRFVPPE